MKKALLLALCCMAFLVFWAGGAWGATFCVDNATDLGTALSTAASNGQDDVIKVVQGTYSGHFIYSSSEGHSITVLGGYSAGCADRVVDPANTVLDGGGSGRVLYLHNSSGGDIQVDGFTIQHGGAADYGAGIFAQSQKTSGTAGAVTITNNIIAGNSTITGRGGGVYASSWSDTGTAGTVTITNNIIQDNSATDSGGGVEASSGSDAGTAGTVTITNNIIQDNSVPYEGGGVDAGSWSDSGTAGTVTITNNIITGNSSTTGSGSGVYAESSSEPTEFGTAGTVTITNNTITGNSAADYGGGAYLRVSGSSGGTGTVNCYNNIAWGNIATMAGGDVYLEKGTGVAYAYNNDVADTAGSDWDSPEDGNIDADPLFVDPGHWDDNGTPGDPSDDFWVDGDYHLQPLSPCIDTGLNSAPGIPAQDFEGDYRIIDGNRDGTPTVDMGADEFSRLPILEAPLGGTIFAGCSLISKYQPAFRWTVFEPFKSFTIFFSTSDNDFSTKGVFITKANIKGTKSSYLPSSGVWKKLFTASWNSGSIRPVYWKVIGKRADKSTAESAVWSFSVDAPYPPVIYAPLDGAVLPAVTPPIFEFYTNCNVKFRLEISTSTGFAPKQTKAFTYTIKDPNVTDYLSKTLSSGQWKAVQKLIGTNTGYFRVIGWDVIKRQTDSATQSFTITP